MKTQRRPRATWIPGKAQKYESLWILFHKFLLLNCPTSGDIAEIFSNQIPSVTHTSLGPYAPAFLRSNFARILGEKVKQIQYCTLDPFRGGLSGFFDTEMRYCPVCLERAYHTFLFSLSNLSRCPIHNEPLLRTCPKCNNPFETCLSEQVINAPGKCKCGHVLLGKNFFKLKIFTDKELAPLTSIVSWSISHINRCDFFSTQLKNKPEEIKTSASHLDFLGIDGSRSSFSVIQTRPVITKSNLFYTHYRKPSRTITPSHSDSERPYTSVYKAIRRHITKEFLKNRTREYRILGSKANTSFSLKELYENERSIFSFALIIWRKYIENWKKYFYLSEPHRDRFIHQRKWSFDLNQWRGPEIPCHITDSRQLHCPTPSTAAEHEWVHLCFFSEDLLGFWWQVLSRVRDWVSGGQTWLDLCMNEPSPISSYSCTRDKSGGLTLIVHRDDNASQNFNQYAEGDGKAIRIKKSKNESEKKKNMLINSIKAAPIILTYRSEIGWSVERAHAPLTEDARNYKRRRLLIREFRRLHFILFRAEQYWIARCLEFSVQTLGTTTADAVSMLKIAVLQRAKLN